MLSRYHKIEDIERAALRIPCVPTDNRDALIALGFERMYPNATSEYESRLWVRSIEHLCSAGSANQRRYRIIQRAFLEETSERIASGA